MDDPGDFCWSWPHWKFGLKRDDLFTKLHDQYNTFPSSIQDPEAFHHDVFEISHQATTTDEFHHLLQDRKQQRLRELNESLESAAFEIIANPSLIGTEQWQHAVQLFRTKSLDSLVRYFASYLPEDHPWHKPVDSSSPSETSSVGSLFNDSDDEHIITHEPLDISESFKSHLPPSPRSMTTYSDSSVASPCDISDRDYDLNTLTPARTLSFSESESDCFVMQDSHSDLPDLHDDGASQSSGPASPATSVSDVSEAVPYETVEVLPSDKAQHDEPTSQSMSTVSALDCLESETPTPKPERHSAFFFDAKPSLPHRRHRSVSPSRARPLSESEVLVAPYRDPRKYMLSELASPKLGRRDCSPAQSRRRARGEPATRVEKSLPTTTRSRPREWRRFEC
jgi:hypothetical protein